MTTIREFLYASLLAFTSLNFAPRLASAQEMAHGRFTLAHDVHWQNAMVPAGEYRFSLDSNGASGLLTLNKISGSRTGYMVTVHHTEEAKASDLSQLVLRSTPEGSYVSAMQLPDFGVTLRFSIPPATTEKQLARAVTAASGSAR